MAVTMAVRPCFGRTCLLMVCIAVAACAGDASPNTDRAHETTNRELPDEVRRPERVAATPQSPTRDSKRATGMSPRVACVVTAVSDGDSFRCRDIQRVRLLLIDAPEMDQQQFGVRARDALRAKMPRGDTVWLEFDVQREDRYGRTLAHAWTAREGGVHLNLQQARDGWAVAVVFPPNVRHIEDVRRAVASARREGRGLWQDGTYRCEPIAHKQGKC